MHSRLQSLLPYLSVAFLGTGVTGRVASAQPAPSDTPSETPPADTSTPAAPPPAPAPTAEVKATANADAGTISGTIRSLDLDAPLSGATVTIEGTNISATTDEGGRFQLSAPPGRATVRADFSGFRSVSRPRRSS